MTDVAAFRDGVGRLLAEVQRIKGEGDYPAAAAAVRRARRALRSGAARRGRRTRRAAAICRRTPAFVMPRLEAAHGGGGEVVDVDGVLSVRPGVADARIRGVHPSAGGATGLIAMSTSAASRARRTRARGAAALFACALPIASLLAQSGRPPAPSLTAAQSLRARMIAAEDARIAAAAAIAPLLQGLRHADLSIASQAVRGLGRFEQPSFVAHICCPRCPTPERRCGARQPMPSRSRWRRHRVPRTVPRRLKRRPCCGRSSRRPASSGSIRSGRHRRDARPAAAAHARRRARGRAGRPPPAAGRRW